MNRWQLALAVLVFSAVTYVACAANARAEANRAADGLSEDISELVPLLRDALRELQKQNVTQTNDVSVGILSPSRSVERDALIHVLREERERDAGRLSAIGGNH